MTDPAPPTTPPTTPRATPTGNGGSASPETRFIAALHRQPQSRLAALRRDLGDPGTTVEAMFIEGLAQQAGLRWAEADSNRAETRDPAEIDWNTDWAAWQRRATYLVAALYASVTTGTPETRGKLRTDRASIGRLLGRLYGERDHSPSVEQRLIRTVSTDRHTLPAALRHAVRLLDQQDHAPDWTRLLQDTLAWNDGVRRRWSRDFYATGPARDDGAAETATDATDA